MALVCDHAFGPGGLHRLQADIRPENHPSRRLVERLGFRAEGLFRFMEAELGHAPFLVGERATLADVAHYAYVARAPEGLVSLQPYPAIRAWLARVEALPGFVPMLKSPVGLAS